MAELTPRYRVGENTDYGYSPLLNPDGTELAILTEPEDRDWFRDLAPVVVELNRMLDMLEAQVKVVVAAEQIIENADGHPAMCCGKCSRAIHDAEVRAARAEADRDDGVDALGKDWSHILELEAKMEAAEAELTRCNEFLEVAQEVGQRELSRAEAAEAALRGEMK